MKFRFVFPVLAAALLSGSAFAAGGSCLNAQGYLQQLDNSSMQVTYTYAAPKILDNKPVSSCFRSLLAASMPAKTATGPASQFIDPSDIPLQRGCVNACLYSFCRDITYSTPTEIVLSGNGEQPPSDLSMEYYKYSASSPEMGAHGSFTITNVADVDFTPQCGEDHAVQATTTYTW